jgi:nicotinamide-nucleotide amidase
MTDPFEPIVARLADRLVAGGLRLAAAESCTGGWVAKACTDAVGSSRWFERGFVTYSNEAKEELLGVQAETLARHGAVSEATVREMAIGALTHSRADVALAVSGIAGPGGGTPDKPVGTVWFAWAWRGGRLDVRCERFGGDRGAVRRAAVEAALGGLLDGLEP